ncbi:MAG: agmatinase [Dehalococcoidia bacterium]|nr:agmatinase [Dehalococcoidia bacterium]
MFLNESIDRQLFPPRNFGAISSPHNLFENASVVILPVPYDGTTDWRSGTREGPAAIIDASQYMELYDIELDREIHEAGIYTMPEVQPVMSGPEGMVQRVYEVEKNLLELGKKVIMLGGEHSLTTGAVKAHKELFPKLTVLQLDAHADLRDQYLGTGFSHACVMRRVLDICPIVQAGIRSMSLEESGFVKKRGMELFFAREPLERGTINKIVSNLSEKVYITIDTDVFDPGLVPAVGTPEPGGLGWYDTISLLREVSRKRDIVGFDVVELCPREGPAASAYFVARLTYKLIGYMTEPR